MAYIVLAYIVMAYTVVAYIAMAHTVMAYIVMAHVQTLAWFVLCVAAYRMVLANSWCWS